MPHTESEAKTVLQNKYVYNCGSFCLVPGSALSQVTIASDGFNLICFVMMENFIIPVTQRLVIRRTEVY